MPHNNHAPTCSGRFFAHSKNITLCRSRLAGDGGFKITARFNGLIAGKPAPTGGAHEKMGKTLIQSGICLIQFG
ncbi:hypothetical protein V6L78_15855 [Pseudomonas canadensis]|uniref:hypothetical protein n=1 Tax=Pseudomonas canadensis TaxID=915099 RepID=UPI0030D51790